MFVTFIERRFIDEYLRHLLYFYRWIINVSLTFLAAPIQMGPGVFSFLTFSVILRYVRYSKEWWMNGIVFLCNLCFKQSTYWVQMKVMFERHAVSSLLYSSDLNFLSFVKNKGLSCHFIVLVLSVFCKLFQYVVSIYNELIYPDVISNLASTTNENLC